MRLIFFIIATLGTIYFLLKKRQYDYFSTAFFSSCIYFLPGFFGYALFPKTTFSNVRYPIFLVDKTYLVMSFVLLGIFVGALFLDLDSTNILINKKKYIGSDYSLVITLFISILGFILTYITTGDLLFNPNKRVMVSEMNRFNYLWTIGAGIGANIAFLKKKRKALIIFIFLLLFDVYIGRRSTFAITIISIFTLWLSSKGKQRLLINNWKIIVMGIPVSIFMFAYKYLYVAIKLGAWDKVVMRLLDFDFYVKAITQSEPFTTQAILNEVVANRFYIGLNHFSGILNQLVLFSNKLGAKNISFNSIFQSYLFPHAKAEMGNNIWAEMYSSGRWILLILFILLFVLLIRALTKYLNHKDLTVRAGVSLMASYLTFYIHRNDIQQIITLSKRVLLFYVGIGLMSMIIYEFLRVKKVSN